jgi:hypothetical protein
MKKTFEKIIRHEYEIDEEALKTELVALNNEFHYDKNEYFDAAEVFCDLCDNNFEILVDGFFLYTIDQIDAYFDFDFYATVEAEICDMIETFFLEREN